MNEQRDKVVCLISVDDELTEAEVDKFGGIKWITMPQETFDAILDFLEHPEKGVRRERPKRKEEASGKDQGPGPA